MAGLEINGDLNIVGNVNVTKADIVNIKNVGVVNIDSAHVINVDSVHIINIADRQMALEVIARLKVAHNIDNHTLGLKCAELRVPLGNS